MSARKRHRVLRFETMRQPMLSRRAFYWRILRNFLASALLIGLSLAGGMLGYRHFESMEWIDAFVNAAMILSGMGPLSPLQTPGGKIFAGCYALYSGLAVILAAGLIFAPLVHRLLHHFHIADD